MAIWLGACDAWTSRHLMNPDGVSYIDIADNYARGEWWKALNAYWNPLYCWILAAGLKVFRPSPASEFPVVHLLNFGIYLFALGAFAFFWQTLLDADGRRRPESAGGMRHLWTAFAYTVFIVFSLEWIGVGTVSPDLLFAGIFYSCCGVALWIRARKPDYRFQFALGLCLGAAYLAKVASATPALLCLGTAGLMAGRSKLRTRAVALAAGLILATGFYIAALSRHEGHFTLSEAGKLNYAWYVNAVPNHWMGKPPDFGSPLHPHRQLLAYPAAFAFDGAAPGTHPGWYDPAYWYAGVKPRLEIGRQLYVIKDNAHRFFEFVRDSHALGIAVLLLTLVIFAGRQCIPELWGRWPLIVPAVLMASLYGLVWVESRFFGAAFAVFCLALLSAVREAVEVRSDPRMLRCVVIAAIAVTLVPVMEGAAVRGYQIGRAADIDSAVAGYLRRSGLGDGDRVAAIGHVLRCGWARQARVKITAEIPVESLADFDTADDALKRRAVDALFESGVRAVVADHRVETGCGSGWKTVGRTGFVVCFK